MRMLTVLACLLSGAAFAEGRPWPFITIRQADVLAAGEKFREIISVNARHPGSADEFWLCFRAGEPVRETALRLSSYERYIPEMRRAGIAVGSQQGVTLGHGDMDPAEAFYPEDAFQLDRTGRRMARRCPRSPFLLEYEADLVEAAVRTMHLESVWLDDDLRMTGGAEGCFCERCIRAFNSEYGLELTREELVRRLDSAVLKEPLREKWRLFKNKTLAVFAAAARRGADRVDPRVRFGYQSVDANYVDAGENYLPLMQALAGERGGKSAIRVGSGNYFESISGCFTKTLSVAREAERCRRSPIVAQISYEQENYTREVLHKSAEAVLIESAMALAAGADALTEYWWSPVRDEPVSYYEEFAETIVEWRPYLEALAAVSRRTSLGGLARYRGADFLKLKEGILRCPEEGNIASVGIPVTVFDARQGLYFVTQKTLDESSSVDVEVLAQTGALVDSSVWDAFNERVKDGLGERQPTGKFVKADLSLMGRRNRTLPTHDERIALLDAIDAVRLAPVRIDRIHPLYVYPRISPDGRVEAVTLVNASIGRCPKTVVRIRRPISNRALWLRPGAPPVEVEVAKRSDECTVLMPLLPGSSVGTIVFLSALTASITSTLPTTGASVP